MKREFLNDLLKEHVSEEKTLKDILDKVMDENGKDITSVQTKLTTAEADKKAVQEKLDATNATLEKFKDVDVDELKGEIDALKADLEAKDKDHKAELEKQEYDRAVNDFFGKLPEGLSLRPTYPKKRACRKWMYPNVLQLNLKMKRENRDYWEIMKRIYHQNFIFPVTLVEKRRKTCEKYKPYVD